MGGRGQRDPSRRGRNIWPVGPVSARNLARPRTSVVPAALGASVPETIMPRQFMPAARLEDGDRLNMLSSYSALSTCSRW